MSDKKEVTIELGVLMVIQRHMAATNQRLKTIEEGQKQTQADIKDLHEKVNQQTKDMTAQLNFHDGHCSVQRELTEHKNNHPSTNGDLKLANKEIQGDIKSVKAQTAFQWAVLALLISGLFGLAFAIIKSGVLRAAIP